jgi:AcrR family transcriptional regulator
MIEKQDSNTEEKIILAAEKVFIENGMAGARMQQIADEAGINKALLHYYYRSKEKLFEIVFKTAIKMLVPNLVNAYKSGDGDFFTRLRKFIDSYITIIEKNPHIPAFVIHEVNHRPDQLTNMLAELNVDISFIINDINAAIDAGDMRPINPYDLMINVISLTIFPVVARPMITGIIFKGDKKGYKEFMKHRRNVVADFIINSIRLEKSQQ